MVEPSKCLTSLCIDLPLHYVFGRICNNLFLSYINFVFAAVFFPADNTMCAIFQIVSIAGKEFSISKAKHWKQQKKMATHFVKLFLALKPILYAVI